MGIPGEKFLGKDHEGWEYTSHDLWRKKMIWKPEWKKVWRTEKKQEWVRISTLAKHRDISAFSSENFTLCIIMFYRYLKRNSSGRKNGKSNSVSF